MKSCFFKRMFINNRILYNEFLKGIRFYGSKQSVARNKDHVQVGILGQ